MKSDILKGGAIILAVAAALAAIIAAIHSLYDPGRPVGHRVEPVRVVAYVPAHMEGKAYYGPAVRLAGPDGSGWRLGIDGTCVPQAIAAIGRDVPMTIAVTLHKDGSTEGVVSEREQLATLCLGEPRRLPPDDAGTRATRTASPGAPR